MTEQEIHNSIADMVSELIVIASNETADLLLTRLRPYEGHGTMQETVRSLPKEILAEFVKTLLSSKYRSDPRSIIQKYMPKIKEYYGSQA